MNVENGPDASMKLTGWRLVLWAATLPLASVLLLLATSGVGFPFTLGAGLVLVALWGLGELFLRRRGARKG
ncbi:hypothetical protein GCM10009739_10630 [Microbacterium ulmi]